MNSSWTFNLSGSFDGSGDLNLSGSVTDGTKTGNISGTMSSSDVSTFTGGEYMGFGERFNDDTTSGTDVNSFSVVPEPGAYALLIGLGSLGFVVLRRRRKG